MKRHDFYFRTVMVFVMCKAIVTMSQLFLHDAKHDAHGLEGEQPWSLDRVELGGARATMLLQKCAAAACAYGKASARASFRARARAVSSRRAPSLAV